MSRPTATDFNDIDLVNRLRHPDTCRKAFEEVIARYGEPLYWQIRRMVQSHEDADDLLQNTFLKAWSSIENFRGDAKLSTWLYKIAINEALSFLDKESRRGSVSLDDEESSIIHSHAPRKAAAGVQHALL